MDGDGSIGESDTPPLHPRNKTNQPVFLGHTKFRGIQFGHEVMHIENDFCPEQFGNECRKHQEVGHRVNLHDIVAPFDVQRRQPDKGI